MFEDQGSLGQSSRSQGDKCC